MSIADKPVLGWKEIEHYFPVYAPGTIRRKYGAEMLERGFVFKSRVGKRRNSCVVWTFPSLIVAFISAKQEENGSV